MNHQVAANVCRAYPQVKGLVARVRQDSLVRAARRKSSGSWYLPPRGNAPRESPEIKTLQTKVPKVKIPESKIKASKSNTRGDAPAGVDAVPRQGCGCREVSEISAGGVQPAHRSAIGRVPERLQLVVPRLAQQQREFVLQRATQRGMPRPVQIHQ